MRREMRAQPPLENFAFMATIYDTIIEKDFSEADRDKIVFSAEGSEGVRLHFRPDGIVIFDFSASPPYSGGMIPAYWTTDGQAAPPDMEVLHKKRLDLMYLRGRYVNAFLACFNSAKRGISGLTPPASPQNYIKVEGSNDSWHLKLESYERLPPLVTGALHISREEICDAVRLLNTHDPDVAEVTRLDILSLLYVAAYNIENHDHDSGLALSWVVAERCQNVLWKRFVDSGYKRINSQAVIMGKRKDILMSSRDFTASIKSQILNLAGVYTDDTLRRMDEVRRIRNDFMHNLERAYSRESGAAILIANEVLSLVLKTHFKLFGSPAGKG